MAVGDIYGRRNAIILSFSAAQKVEYKIISTNGTALVLEQVILETLDDKYWVCKGKCSSHQSRLFRELNSYGLVIFLVSIVIISQTESHCMKGYYVTDIILYRNRA
jgi:hypothetical protein